MARILGHRENFRVVVEPRGLGDLGFISMSDRMACGNDPARIEREYQQRCEEIAQQIKRHIDNVAYASVEFDQAHVCSHCGARWSEESTEYNGGCCSTDQEIYDAEQERR
jgi:hypothetical protein